MTGFEGKICLITGASRGIGYQIAQRFAKRGATVITAQRSKASGFVSYELDLSKAEASERLIERVISDYGQLDILVNNAGIMKEARLDKMGLATFQKTITVNLTTPFWLMAKALPYLVKRKGAIVNIGSIEGLGANPHHTAYAASKGGLHALTKAAAVDAGPLGVRVNAVAPGWINTALNEDYINAMPDPVAFRESIGAIHPVGHTGEPEDVAALVTFLASEEARFITGQIMVIDGGRMTQLPLP